MEWGTRRTETPQEVLRPDFWAHLRVYPLADEAPYVRGARDLSCGVSCEQSPRPGPENYPSSLHG